MQRPNRRNERRLEVELLVRVVGVDGQRVSFTRNLSIGGVMLERDLDSLVPGSDFELELQLPGCSGAVGCAGTVVYARGRLAGLRFTSVPECGQRMIDSFLAAQLDRPGSSHD